MADKLTAPVQGHTKGDHLGSARAAACWIVSRQSELHWPRRSNEPSEEPVDLYHGTAGTILFLRELAESTGEQSYRDIALTGAAHIAGQLEKVTASGLYRGLAGIIFALDQMVQASDDSSLLDALNLASKAESSDCLLFHDDAAGRDLFYLGWCHGPAGTGRLFYRLYQLTHDLDWLGLVKRQAATLMASGIPERQTPGYWNNVSRCCGAAGVGEFFLGLYTAIEDMGYLAFAEHLADYLIARAETDANGLKWTQAERRIEPDNVAAQTGLMQGAAGIGLFLVHLDEVCRHQKPLIQFPDEPFVGKKAGSGE